MALNELFIYNCTGKLGALAAKIEFFLVITTRPDLTAPFTFSDLGFIFRSTSFAGFMTGRTGSAKYPAWSKFIKFIPH
jgi:hypothetical protein